MNLAIDIGNSLAKLAVIENGQVVDFLKTDRPDAAFVAGVLDANPAIDAAIAISCRTADSEVESLLRRRLRRFLRFDRSVPVPIENRYATPETLGPDRLAAAVGAWTLYPGRNILIVDFGTAITIDFVTERGEYLGGNISPGADTRFRALNRFTDTLPLVPAAGEADAAGRLDAVGHRIRRRERHRIRDRGLYPRSGAALRRPENRFYRRRERFFCQKTKKYDICNLRPGGLRPEPNS